MKVKDMIDLLKKLDPESDVYTDYGSGIEDVLTVGGLVTIVASWGENEGMG